MIHYAYLLRKVLSNKLPISAMIVGFNEARFLRSCLESISFCDEIVYTDLGSIDGSIEIAESFSARIYKKKRVPYCEIIQSEMVKYLKNDWVIFIDPDEQIDTTLISEIRTEFRDFVDNENLGAIVAPWQFYFKNYRLQGTAWGGLNKKYLLVHKNRFTFEPIAHYGRNLMPTYSVKEIVFNGDRNVLHHYWMNSYRVFIKKHIRYLKNEGKDQFSHGVRFTFKKLILTPFKEFHYCYFIKKGYKDFLVGLSLSMFWSFYKTYIACNVFILQIKKYRNW